jgi:hypothetical protein
MGAQITVIAEKPLTTCVYRKFHLDPLGDHLNTCTAHSGAKKAHDWIVDQIADRADYDNNPPNTVSFMPAIGSTTGRLHTEFVRLLFLQAHRETDRFFAVSGVHLV